MGFNLGPSDLMTLLVLPAMFLTAKQAKSEWSSLWDSELTESDRRTLQRIAVFWLLPIVVLFHELGHVAAAKYFGKQVVEFHYNFLSGYVTSVGAFTPDQVAWLAFSGNLVQIIIGLVALFFAIRSKSPPVVALLIYVFLWAVGGTVIVYALMSAARFYGDWEKIYTSGAQPLVAEIAVFHAIMVALVLFCLCTDRAKDWFFMKTEPQFAEPYKALTAIARSKRAPLRNRVQAYIGLAETYWFLGLNDEAIKNYDTAIKIDPSVADAHLYKGARLNDAQRFSDAERELSAIYNLEWIDPNLQQAAINELQRARDGLSQQQ